MKRTVILLCVLVFSAIGQAQAEMRDPFYLLKGDLSLGYLAGEALGSSTAVGLSYTWHKRDITSTMLVVN